MSDNALCNFQEDLTTFAQLGRLYVARNVLTQLPCLQRLRVLDISDNRLRQLDLHGFVALKILNASGRDLLIAPSKS